MVKYISNFFLATCGMVSGKASLFFYSSYVNFNKVIISSEIDCFYSLLTKKIRIGGVNRQGRVHNLA